MKVQILLAEDNRADVMLVREALAVHQIEHVVHVLEDGEVALRYISRIGVDPEAPCPDVLLLDLNLPKAEGIEILRGFRSNAACASTPVIIVTSSDAVRERERAHELGVSRYFRKPSSLAAFLELGAVVRDVLKESEALATF
jgi:DNA-binding response OmpR family regulator